MKNEESSKPESGVHGKKYEEDWRTPHHPTSLPSSFAPFRTNPFFRPTYFLFSVAPFSNVELDETFMLPFTSVILGKNFYQLFRKFLDIVRDPRLFF